MGAANPRLPRVPGSGGQPALIRGRVWNRLCDIVEKFTRLTAVPPLIITPISGGMQFSIAGGQMTAVARVTSATSGGSFYNGRLQVFKPAQLIDPSINLTWSNIYQDMNAADDCYIVHIPANGVGSRHWFKTDGSVFVWGTVLGTTDQTHIASRPIVAVESVPTGSVLPCTLASDGGSPGSNSPPTKPTLTYTATGLDGVQIATGISVWNDRQYGHTSGATHGLEFTDYSNTHWVICEEPIDATQCS